MSNTKKTIINLRATLTEDIPDGQQPLLRLFYWASYFGFEADVDLFISNLKWSPFIKSFKKQSALSGAMRGGNIETAKLILSYDYKSNQPDELANSRINKDLFLNTSLHYSYLNDDAEYREVLRENDAADEAALNRRGKNAKAFSHKMKYDSEDEEVNDEEGEEARRLRRKYEMLNTPDYLFVCRPSTAHVVERNLRALESLDVSYTTIPNEKEDRMLVCVFFTDDTYDVMAEILRVKTRLKMYSYMSEFKGYA